MSLKLQPQMSPNPDIENIVARGIDADSGRPSGSGPQAVRSQASAVPDPAKPDPLSPLVALLARRAALRYRRQRGLGLLQTAIVLAVVATLLAVLVLTMGGSKP